MGPWIVTIEAWPFSTSNGTEIDQKAAGQRSVNYAVRAMDAADALRIAEYIATGVRANPMVWRAPITSIIKQS